VAPSVFLTELKDLVQGRPAGQGSGAGIGTWVEDGELGEENPFRALVETAVWPYDPLEGPHVVRGGEAEPARRGRRAAMEAAAAAVLEAAASGREPEPDSSWAREAELLLRSHNAVRVVREVELPAHISASMLVSLKEDPAAVTRALRRPVPRKPGMAARKGTAFHSWVEEFFGTAGMLDLDEYVDPADAYVDEAYDLDAMKETFKASEFADKVPAAVEVPVETRIDEVVVRGRIDAVFQGPGGRWELVDWKTGAPPSGEKLKIRAVQLAAYRLAWARLQQVPVEQVSAAFYYVAADKVIRPHDLAGEAELEAVVRSAYGG
jgi:DNA helicase-2/ATP-dependent DNA helicase PcrA